MTSLDDLDVDALDFGGISPQEFAGLVKDTSRSALAAVVAGPARGRILDEVFGRMETRFRPETAARLRALVRWFVVDAGHPDAVYETEIADGRCTLTRGDSGREPRLVLTLSAAEFLRLVSGNASGVTLFMTRKLKVAGDLGLASGLTRYFDIPKA
ncbi:SCP2 sterol-binding domain-containing protein [Streptomyces sp. CB03911]|uniref:SCP2 sterol-binding domain-containing protein n=1 Tax=Streptomycetaceae TaxID=2062 RepID=UPI00093BC6CE|nr:SCP2 sterol-binding domain-containing protein [Streptomyces sp. CB03911]OKI28819.1 acyl-CoA synthase [Streptomyces sp. CB03911]